MLISRAFVKHTSMACAKSVACEQATQQVISAHRIVTATDAHFVCAGNPPRDTTNTKTRPISFIS